MLNPRDCTARLADLLRREHAALGEFLLALADFDRRRLWLALGHPSLFSFLHLGRAAAGRGGLAAAWRRRPSLRHRPPTMFPIARVQRSRSAGRYIPAAVRREVWKRDGGCCQWPLAAGGVCGSRTRLEFDHVMPMALGGPSEADNVRLLCKVHNAVAARRCFGDACMDRYARATAAVNSAGWGATTG